MQNKERELQRKPRWQHSTRENDKVDWKCISNGTKIKDKVAAEEKGKIECIENA